MRAIWISIIMLMLVTQAQAVVITCVNEGSNVVRIDYSAADETVLPIAFALNITVDNGATIQNVYGYKVGDSNAAGRGYGIFPASMQLNESGQVVGWGTPVVGAGLGTSSVTLGMASRYVDAANAPPVSGTLCRVLVNPNGAQTVNFKVAQNTAGGGVVLENATTAKFTGVGTTIGGSIPPPPGPNEPPPPTPGPNEPPPTPGPNELTPPSAPAWITYPTSSSTGRYRVRWTLSGSAASYQLERSNNSGNTWTKIYSGANRTYSENVANGSYRYRIKATNTAGFSDWRTGTRNCRVNIGHQRDGSNGRNGREQDD